MTVNEEPALKTSRHHLPPGVTDTFHRPCWGCGQAIKVAAGQQQPHECATYETDAERVCAAYWAGYDQARQERAAALDADETQP